MSVYSFLSSALRIPHFGFLVVACLLFFVTLPVRAASIEWISKPEAGGGMRGDSWNAHLSGDGRLVVFQSDAPLLPADKDRLSDVYVFDRAGTELRLLSWSDDGSSSGGPVIDRRGDTAAFYTYPKSVVRGKPPRTSDIVVVDTVKGEPIPIAALPADQDGETLGLRFYGDGRGLVFTSNATNLLPAEKDAFRAVFRMALPAGPIELVSRNADRRPADRPSLEAVVSRDGRTVAFVSAATNLVPGFLDDRGRYDLYLADLAPFAMSRLDGGSGGAYSSDGWLPGRLAMDDDGRTLAFEARPKRDPAETAAFTDVFVYDRDAGTIERAATGRYAGRARGPALSADGRYLAFVADPRSDAEDGGVVVVDRRRRRVREILDSSCRNLSIAADGSAIAFESDRPDATTDDDDGGFDVFVVRNPFFH